MYSAPGTTRKDEYSAKRDFDLRNFMLDGQKAEIITCYDSEVPSEFRGLNYSAVLYVPELPKSRGNLTIWTYNRTIEASKLASKMIESLRFLE